MKVSPLRVRRPLAPEMAEWNEAMSELQFHIQRLGEAALDVVGSLSHVFGHPLKLVRLHLDFVAASGALEQRIVCKPSDFLLNWLVALRAIKTDALGQYLVLQRHEGPPVGLGELETPEITTGAPLANSIGGAD